jgi:nucleosome assembly protein 1-like 1
VVDEEGTDNFTIVFDFAPNELISNKQLTKKYYVQNDHPVKCESTTIEWKGKNLTIKQIRKKQKNKKTGQQRVVMKTVEAKSFFTFFKNI